MPSQRAHEMLPILVDHRRATAWPLTGRKPRASALTRTATRPPERQDHLTVTPAQQPPRPRHRAEPVSSFGFCGAAPEMHGLICPDLISKLISICRQPCYLLPVAAA